MSEIVSASDTASATETVTVVDNSMVRLVSNDGEAFELLASVAKLSKMVATGIEGIQLNYAASPFCYTVYLFREL